MRAGPLPALFLVLGLHAQAFTLSAAVDVNGLRVHSVGETHDITRSLPAGTPLLDGTQITTGGFEYSSVRSNLPALSTGTGFRVTHLAFSGDGLTTNFLSGSTLLTIAPAPSTWLAARLVCSYLGTGMTTFASSLVGTVDLDNDGTADFFAQGSSYATLPLPRVIPPGGLVARLITTAQTGGATQLHSLQLEVVVDSVLAATITDYEPGCGPTLAVRPTVQSSLVVTLTGVPPASTAVALLPGFGRDHQLLPCGACVLGVQHIHPWFVVPPASGIAVFTLPVPRALLPFTVDLQAACADFGAACAIATSNAVEARLSR